jgi:hypothetical protein
VRLTKLSCDGQTHCSVHSSIPIGDFGDLVIRLRLPSRGVLFLRLGMLSAARQATEVLAAVEEHGQNLVDNFVVVEPGRVRFKSPPDIDIL